MTPPNRAMSFPRPSSCLGCNFSLIHASPAFRRQGAPPCAANAEAVDTLDTLLAPVSAGSPRSPLRTGGDRHARSPALGRYRLLERLGSGGFGEVWSAHDELLDRHVAVKIISLPAGEDRERAAREALAAARLSHPAIVALYEACAEDDAFYLISELVHGRTLAQLIASEELTDTEALEIGLALVDALTHAHQRGVVHRDIKPHNVLVPAPPESGAPQRVGAQGSLPPAKLTDFGGALLAGEQSLTRTGDVLGTLAYMAPEQIEGHHVDAQADLYSLALVLYESLCGVNPVRGPTAAATARRIGCELTPLEHYRRDLPRELTRALDHALDPDPESRGTLPALRDALTDTLGRGLPSSGSLRHARRSPAPPTLPTRADFSGPVQTQPPTALAVEHDELEEEIHEADRALDSAGWLTPQRLAWLAAALSVCGWQIAVDRPGIGLLAIAAALPLVLLVRRPSPRWLAAALAPLLGLVGLAAAFPAIAGQPSRWRERALLGALGYWWLRLAEPLLDRPGTRLWLGAPSGVGGAGSGLSAWEGSVTGAIDHAVVPLLALALLLGAALWALAAALLPWIVRGRSAMLDGLAAILWASALAAAAPLLDRGLPPVRASAGGASLQSPHGAILGAILGAAIAVGARALRGPV
jgi:serine/threonine protein kinase